MKLFSALLLIWPLAGQEQFAQFARDVKVHAAVIRSGHVVWSNGAIDAPAPEEPVIAERIPAKLLDTPAPEPRDATIRQVLENRADGTPGEEVLDNPEFFKALEPIARHGRLPNALTFAEEKHGTLGWFVQQYAGQRILFAYGPAILLIRVPGKQLTLVASEGVPVVDANIARSSVALAFFKDVAGLPVAESDELIARAWTELTLGDRDRGMMLTREALDRFPELESTPDVALLHLFAQLRLPQTEASATAVIKDHPTLPTAWFYYADYLEHSKRYREAAACYEQITMHQPPWHNWTVDAAKKELRFLKTY